MHTDRTRCLAACSGRAASLPSHLQVQDELLHVAAGCALRQLVQQLLSAPHALVEARHVTI